MPEQQDTWNLAGNSLDKHNYVVQKTSPKTVCYALEPSPYSYIYKRKYFWGKQTSSHGEKLTFFRFKNSRVKSIKFSPQRFSTFLHVLSVSHVQLNHLLFLTAVLVFDVPISFFLYWFTSVSKRTSSLFWNFLFAGLPFCNRINTYNYNR